jgi:hypothetical protein
LAHKILLDLSNEDLIKVCATNKRMYEICNNYSSFWRNKFVKDYGEQGAQYKPENRSWKDHYITVFIDLEKFKKDSIKFFDYIAWKENIDNSFFIDIPNKKYSPLKYAPEWVMNNLYLLNIKKLKVMERGQRDMIEYINIKPIEFFQKRPAKNHYLVGFTPIHLDNIVYTNYTSPTELNIWLTKMDLSELTKVYFK